ncbi:Usp domain-containing protein, partial [Cephalotus follicularis]
VMQQEVSMKEVKKKVMVAIDESDGSFYALKWAIDHLGCILRDSNEASPEAGILYLIHVQQPFHQFAFVAGPGAGAAGIYAPSSLVESVRKAQEENTAVLLSRALQLCKENMGNPLIKAEGIIQHGDPKDMICQAAEEMHIDLLVVGSRGLGKLKRAFLGSVSDHCAHHAKCPILIVKPP